MKARLEIKADILTAFIKEDRTEIRIIRDRIMNTTSSIVVASFAITAFFYSRQDNTLLNNLRNYASVIDVGLIGLIFALFIVMKRSLYYGRKALMARQKLLNDLNCVDDIDLDPFLVPEDTEVNITDNDLSVLVGFALLILVAKVIFV
ncbi:MAG: hypothetical protein WCF59_02870 [Desulfobaccales bacterium]|jgi:hypothetical protein